MRHDPRTFGAQDLLKSLRVDAAVPLLRHHQSQSAQTRLQRLVFVVILVRNSSRAALVRLGFQILFPLRQHGRILQHGDCLNHPSE
mgnify:CR=1 FL=1